MSEFFFLKFSEKINQFFDLDTFDFSKLPRSLIVLRASHNRLSKIDEYALPRSLGILLLHDNRLTSFKPENLPPTLKQLDLSKNLLTSFNSSALPKGIEWVSLHFELRSSGGSEEHSVYGESGGDDLGLCVVSSALKVTREGIEKKECVPTAKGIWFHD